MIFKPFMAFMCFFLVPPTKARSYIDRMRVWAILFFATLTGHCRLCGHDDHPGSVRCGAL